RIIIKKIIEFVCIRKKVNDENKKMNKTLKEAVAYVDETSKKVPSEDNVETIVCAPFPFLHTLVEGAKGSSLKIGAQTMHYEENGAYTGEVSPLMLQEIGVTHVVIGHSERRQYSN